MLKRIQEFFNSRIHTSGDAQHSPRHSVQLATAALLIEVSHADFDVDAVERQAVRLAVREFFQLSEAETAELIALAEEEAKQSVSLFQFTALVDKEFSAEEKIQIVELMWRVAYADQHNDMHEEHLVRKVAELLHVPHSAFVRTRHRVEREADN